MKPREIRKLETEELAAETQSLRRKLFELRSQAVTEKIHDISQFSKVRRDIARVLTEQSLRQKKARERAAG